MEALSAEERRELANSLQDGCRRAADLIRQSDILLLATGAGMSADSATVPLDTQRPPRVAALWQYRDIADVEVYKKRGLTYAHLCRTTWLNEEPELFYGFWGACWNDYNATEPHSGYQLIRGWKEYGYVPSAGDERRTRIHDMLHERQRHYSSLPTWFEDGEGGAWEDGEGDPFEEDEQGEMGCLFHSDEAPLPPERTQQATDRSDSPFEPADAFFIFTSNVDGHHQKAGFRQDEVFEVHGSMNNWQCSVPCTDEVWPLPHGYSFRVDRKQMTAQPEFPECGRCGAHARPAVQMYYDRRRIENEEQKRKYLIWKRAVRDVLRSVPDARLVILEIGCGTNVSTVRLESEDVLAKSEEGRCTLVRINLEYPKCHWRPHLQRHMISVQANAAQALREIDKHLRAGQ